MKNITSTIIIIFNIMIIIFNIIIITIKNIFYAGATVLCKVNDNANPK